MLDNVDLPENSCSSSCCSSTDWCYGSAALAAVAGIQSHLLSRLQSVMNAAARLIFSSSRFDQSLCSSDSSTGWRLRSGLLSSVPFSYINAFKGLHRRTSSINCANSSAGRWGSSATPFCLVFITDSRPHSTIHRWRPNLSGCCCSHLEQFTPARHFCTFVACLPVAPQRLISSPFPITVRDHVQCSRSDTFHFGHFNRSRYLLTYLPRLVSLCFILFSPRRSSSLFLMPNLKKGEGKDVDLYRAFHAPGTPNAHVTETGPPDRYFRSPPSLQTQPEQWPNNRHRQHQPASRSPPS